MWRNKVFATAAVLALCLIARLSATTLLQDTFTGTNGTALTAHTMNVGSGWTSLAGTWEIQSNHAKLSGNTFDADVTADAGVADGTVSADFDLPAACTFLAGLSIRTSDANNGWYVVLECPGTINLTIYERVAGTNTQKASQVVGSVLSTTQALTVTLSGSTISAQILPDGSSTSYGSAASNQTVTKHGLASWTNGMTLLPVTIDNFLFDGTGGVGGSTPCRRSLLGVGCDLSSGEQEDTQRHPYQHHGDSKRPFRNLFEHKTEHYSPTVSPTTSAFVDETVDSEIVQS